MITAKRRLCVLVVILMALVPCLQARQFHVTVNAQKSADGSRRHPWRLEIALSHPHAVRPGDTIWVHGGVYSGRYVSRLQGTGDAPVILRAYPGERVTIDGGRTGERSIFLVEGSYAWYWGFEVMSSDPQRVSTDRGSWPQDLGRGECVTVNQDMIVRGCKFINLVLHDGRQGFSAWKPAEDIEVYGCVMYNNGWIASDRPHGHNIYTQNETGTKRFAENILSHAFSHNIQVYGSDSASLNNFVFEGNIVFQGGERNVLIGGGRKAMNPRFVGNFLFEPGGGNIFNLGYYPWGKGVEGAMVTGNYFIGGELSFRDVAGSVFQDNTIYAVSLLGLSPGRYPKNSWSEVMPREVRAFVRANYYERGRGNVVVYNGGKQNSVHVDVSSVLSRGEAYVLLDAENYFGRPVLEGTYKGGTLEIPMVARDAALPVGMTDPPSHTPAVFGAFVVLRR